MNKFQLGELLDAFAEFYWSVPMSFVCAQITAWHPELEAGYIMKAARGMQNAHHWIVSGDGLEETELTAEHLYALGDKDLFDFVAARRGDSWFPATEEQLLRLKEYPNAEDTAEAAALREFARQVMGLDDEWTDQLLADCLMSQADALCGHGSWVRGEMQSERFGQIRFTSLDQLAELRRLGNAMYLYQPNPVLKGWRPCDTADAPPLPDELPDEAELAKCLKSTRELDETFAKMRQTCGLSPGDDEGDLMPPNPPPARVGRNDPCPCGSGLKYKKCCGKNA